MPVPPPSILGTTRPYWKTEELSGCPSGTLICAVCPDRPDDGALQLLVPEELEYAVTLETHYRRAWLAGRICLATALAHLSAPRLPILSLASGAPIVPSGFAGSISRKGPLTLAVASVAAQAIGIDVECTEESDQKLAKRVLTAAERARLQQVDSNCAALFITAHFAMKEAVYKTLRAEDQETVDFQHIELATSQEQVTASNVWTPVATQVSCNEYAIQTVLFVDQDWVIAVASRE